jgi:hypothetical protein
MHATQRTTATICRSSTRRPRVSAAGTVESDIEMDKSETIIELAKALVKAQGQISPALKDSENPHFRSKYADLSSVWAACRKPLTDNGLSVVQMPVDAPTPGSVALTTLLLHTSGEYISSTVSAPLTKQDAQGIGSALTYLRRYALSAIIGVVADEDDDGNAASRPQATSYSAPQQQHPQAPAPRQQPAQQATAPSGALLCDVCGTPAKDGKWGPYCPAKENHGGKFYTIKAAAARTLPNDWDAEYADIDATR